MSNNKQKVVIKGIKDGLVFMMDDKSDFTELLSELNHKLSRTHQNILTGPIVHVHIKMGNRYVDERQKEEIRAIIGQKGNLFIQTIDSLAPKPVDLLSYFPNAVFSRSGIIRSGQTIEHEGNLLFLGDVNPGGVIMCTGDIYVIGSLKGIAKAGTKGNHQAIIAASHLRPSQLQIADVLSRPPDEWGIQEMFMEFAYIKDGKMEIEKIQQLQRIRPQQHIE
jgi:septum site-determining protein MinC